MAGEPLGRADVEVRANLTKLGGDLDAAKARVAAVSAQLKKDLSVEAHAKLTVDLVQARQQVAAVSGAIKQEFAKVASSGTLLQSVLEPLASRAGLTGTALKAMGPAGLAAAAGVGAIGFAVGNAVRDAAEFNKTLADLSAITGATGRDLEFLRGKALEFSRDSTQSARDVAEAFKLVASAKPELLANAQALAAVTKEVITLSEASGLGLADAAKATTSALAQFGAGAGEAARFVNVLAAGSKFGKAEIPELADALVKAGTVAKTAGVSFELTVATLEKLAEFGAPAEEFATGFRNVLLKLEAGATATRPSVVGLTQALINLGNKGFTIADLAAEFGDRQAVVAQQMIATARGAAQLSANVTGTKTAQEQAAAKTDNLIDQTKRLGSAFSALGIQIQGGQNILTTFARTSADVLNRAAQVDYQKLGAAIVAGSVPQFAIDPAEIEARLRPLQDAAAAAATQISTVASATAGAGDAASHESQRLGQLAESFATASPLAQALTTASLNLATAHAAAGDAARQAALEEARLNELRATARLSVDDQIKAARARNAALREAVQLGLDSQHAQALANAREAQQKTGDRSKGLAVAIEAGITADLTAQIQANDRARKGNARAIASQATEADNFREQLETQVRAAEAEIAIQQEGIASGRSLEEITLRIGFAKKLASGEVKGFTGSVEDELAALEPLIDRLAEAKEKSEAFQARRNAEDHTHALEAETAAINEGIAAGRTRIQIDQASAAAAARAANERAGATEGEAVAAARLNEARAEAENQAARRRVDLAQEIGVTEQSIGIYAKQAAGILDVASATEELAVIQARANAGGVLGADEEAQIRALIRMQDEMRKLQRVAQAVSVDIADRLIDSFTDILSVGQDALAELFAGGKVDAEDFAKTLKRVVTDALAEIALKRVIIPILAQIAFSGAGALGIGGGGGAGATGGGAGFLGLLQQGQSLLSFGKTMLGGFSSLTSAVNANAATTGLLQSDIAALNANGISIVGEGSLSTLATETGSTINLGSAGSVAPAATGSASSLLLIPGLGVLSADFFNSAFGSGRFTASGSQLTNFALGTIFGSAAVGGAIGGGAAIVGGTAAAASTAAGGGIAGLSAGAGAVGGGVAGGAVAGGIAGIVLAAAGIIGFAIAKNLGAFKGPTGGTLARGAFSGFLTQPDNGIPYFAGGDFYNDRGQAEANMFARDLNRREPGDPGYQVFNQVLFSDWLTEEQQRHPETWMRDLPDDYWSRVDPTTGGVLPGQNFLFEPDETRNRRANDTFYQGLERYIAQKAGNIGLTDEQLNVGTGLTTGFRVRLGEDVDLQQPSRQMALLASLLGNIEDLGLDAAQSMEVFAAAVEQLGPGQTVLKDINDFFTSDENDLSVDVYRDSIQGLAEIYFHDLPQGVDASKVAIRELEEATDEFGQQGTVSFNDLKERIAAATAEAEAFGDAIKTAFVAGIQEVDIAHLAEQLADLDMDPVSIQATIDSLTFDPTKFGTALFDTVEDQLKQSIAEAVYEGFIDGAFQGDILGPFLARFKEITAKVKAGEITQDEGNALLAQATADARDNLELLRPLINNAVAAGKTLAEAFDDAGASAEALGKIAAAFNRSIAEQTLSALSPDLADQYQLEIENRNRLAAARAAGGDLAAVEHLNGILRANLLKKQGEDALREQERQADEQARLLKAAQEKATQALKGIKDAIDAALGGSNSPLTPRAAVQHALQEFNALATKAAGGDLEAAEDLPEAFNRLLDTARGAFASGPEFAGIFTDALQKMQDILAKGPGPLTHLEPGDQAIVDAVNENGAEAQALLEALLAAFGYDEHGNPKDPSGPYAPPTKGTSNSSPTNPKPPDPYDNPPSEGRPRGGGSGLYGNTPDQQSAVQQMLAGLVPGGATEDALRQLLSLSSFSDVQTLALIGNFKGEVTRAILGDYPGVQSLAGFDRVVSAMLSKIADPGTYSSVLGFARGGITDRPAVFGEGGGYEAAIPLDSGRRIPIARIEVAGLVRGLEAVLRPERGAAAALADALTQNAQRVTLGELAMIEHLGNLETRLDRIEGRMGGLVAAAGKLAREAERTSHADGRGTRTVRLS